jgi:hypothetical protein
VAVSDRRPNLPVRKVSKFLKKKSPGKFSNILKQEREAEMKIETHRGFLSDNPVL